MRGSRASKSASATLQTKSTGGITFVEEKLITQDNVPGAYFVEILGQDGILVCKPVDMVQMDVRPLARHGEKWLKSWFWPHSASQGRKMAEESQKWPESPHQAIFDEPL